MYYGNIKNCDIADGEGVRISLFVSGCRNHCKGCFQPETWDFNFGKPYTKETEDRIIELMKPEYIDGLTLLGGDPFENENQEELVKLLERVKKEFGDTKDIWCYTGYIYEDIISDNFVRKTPYTKKFIDLIDILVDGPFIEEEKDLTLKFRGSRNQRILNLKEKKSQSN